jgi:ribosome-associated toxin RatA of RatAB toxin-antitoxin module
MKVKMHFATRNHNTPHSKIEMQLVDGPFKELTGTWQFMPLGERGCKINFELNYKFSNFLLEKVIGPVFNLVSKNIVECFIKEANKQYGTNND